MCKIEKTYFSLQNGQKLCNHRCGCSNIVKVTVTIYLFMQISTIILTLHEQQCKPTILHFTGLALLLCNVKLALICSLVIPTTTNTNNNESSLVILRTITAVIFPNTIINVRLTKKKQDLLKVTLCTTRKTWSTVNSHLTWPFTFTSFYDHPLTPSR